MSLMGFEPRTSRLGTTLHILTLKSFKSHSKFQFSSVVIELDKKLFQLVHISVPIVGLFFAFCPNQTFTFLLLLFAPDFSHLTGGGWVFPDFNVGPPELCAAFDGRDEGPKNGCCCCPSGANGPSVCLSVASERKSNVQSSRIRPQDKSQLRDSRAAGQVLNLLILHPLHLLVPVKHEIQHEQDSQKVPFW